MEPMNCPTLIKQIHDAVKKRLDNDLKARDLTMMQIVTLKALDETEDGKLTFKQLEKILRVSQPTTVGVVARLAQKGFVEKTMHNRDRRAKFAIITEAGKEYSRSAHTHLEVTEKELMEGLTQEEQDEVIRLLTKINENAQGW